LPFDAPLAEPAPTRRSSRTSATPVQASSETLGASRAELRRRAGESAAERPAVVWGRPQAPSLPEVAATAVAAAAASIPVTAEVPAPVAATPAPSAPVAALPPASEAVEAARPETAQPLSRRARRSPRTAEQPVVPPIAIDSPAPAEQVVPDIRPAEPTPAVAATLPDAVLIPAEPFVLLEPVVEPEPDAVVTPTTEPFVLLEPVAESFAEPAPEPAEPVAQAQPEASDVDAFEAAARLFSFTGETPIQSAAKPASDEAADSHSARRRSRPSNGAAFRRVTAASFSVGVMGIVGLLTVGMTTPAEAVAAASGYEMPVTVMAPSDTEIEVDRDEIQAYVAPAGVEEVPLARSENYSTVTTAQLAAQSGIANFSNFFVNDPNSAIQWPFAVGVPITYGFGMRSGRMHEGADFVPGAGAPIQAIADGVVRIATSSGGAYGVTVVIDHQIDGQLVSSRYAHMQYGSLQVSPGQQVGVGTILGRTGNTGRSYGAHTHFEILMNGTTAIDPIPWLRQHAGG